MGAIPQGAINNPHAGAPVREGEGKGEQVGAMPEGCARQATVTFVRGA